MPIWFLKKKIKFYFWIGVLIFLSILASNINFYFLITGFGITGLLFFWGIDSLDKRSYGIKLEKEAYKFIRNKFPEVAFEFRKKMNYGDIDIFVKDLNIAIDIKAYRKFDKRVFSQKNIKSILRQKEITEKVVVWLPNSYKEGIFRNDGFIVITGKNSMVQYLSRELSLKGG